MMRARPWGDWKALSTWVAIATVVAIAAPAASPVGAASRAADGRRGAVESSFVPLRAVGADLPRADATSTSRPYDVEDVDGRTTPAVATRQTAPITSFSNDHCDDAPSGHDTWFTVVERDPAAPGDTLFAVFACEQLATGSWGDTGYTAFYLDTQLDGDGRDYIIGFRRDTGFASGVGVEVIRTPGDVDTWYGVAYSEAQHPRDDTVGAWIPDALFGAPSTFAFDHETYMGTGEDSDLMPEFDEFAATINVYPNVCNAQQHATVEGDPAALEVLTARLEQAGVHVADRTRTLGWVGVRAPVEDPVLQAAARAAGVRVHPARAATSQALPDDPGIADQWNLRRVAAPEGWAQTVGDPDVVVAIIDSGVDGRHPDFDGRLQGAYNALTGTRSPNPTNNARGGHGTTVASVAAATGNNGSQLAGITWTSTVMPILVSDPDGCMFDYWVADGITYAVDNGADVINLSLGGGDRSEVLAAALDHAASHGVIVVAAAGNGGATQSAGYPASAPSTIAVGSTSRDGPVSTFSQGGAALDVVAPGEEIPVLGDNLTEFQADGTSLAAPHVTGAAALWLAQNPDGTPEGFRAAVRSTATDIGPAGRDSASGDGELHLGRLLAPAEPPEPPAPPSEPPPEPAPEAPGQTPVAESPTTTSGALFDGDPTTTRRVDVATATDAAVELSAARFSSAADGDDERTPAAWAVLSRDDVFADSLGGSALTADGPLLLTRPTGLTASTREELLRVLPPGAGVFLLGGESAISGDVAAEITALGLRPIRLAGPSRIETALAVADEVRRRYGTTGAALLARADDWADSVAAGAYAAATRTPILLTDTGGLHGATAEWLAADNTARVTLLGGTAALSPAVEAAVPGPVRVAGPERSATAASIATDLMGARDAGERRFTIVNGNAIDGWAFGLAAAGAAAHHDAPLLMVRTESVPDATAALVTACDVAEVDLLILGGRHTISDQAAGALDRMDGSC